VEVEAGDITVQAAANSEILTQTVTGAKGEEAAEETEGEEPKEEEPKEEPAAEEGTEKEKDISVGMTILIDDGLIEMTVEDIKGEEIICHVVNGGFVSNHKGVNVPGAVLSMPYISDVDRADIEFGCELGFDFLAASFARTKEDIHAICRPTFTRSLYTSVQQRSWQRNCRILMTDFIIVSGRDYLNALVNAGALQAMLSIDECNKVVPSRLIEYISIVLLDVAVVVYRLES
jgi:hypothetical protein